MYELVLGLAELTSMRDHDMLGVGFVRLVRRFCGARPLEIRLVSLVGDADDRRCRTMVFLRGEDMVPHGPQANLDWARLPQLRTFPLRQRALMTGLPEMDAGPPCQLVLPIGTPLHYSGLLEIDTPEALTTEDQALVLAILRVYQNLLSLLDYGERDTLTGLLNRKTFDGAFLLAAIEQGAHAHTSRKDDRRGPNPVSSYWLAMLDIDHFKRVNDEFGHLIGDEVLLLLARLMRSSFRLDDQLYRFGGEEFVALLRCASHDDALHVLERFRQSVSEYAFPQVGHITVSIGFTMLRPDDTPGEAFGRADRAVYYGKEHGRNQVCSYHDLVLRGELHEVAGNTQEADLF